VTDTWEGVSGRFADKGEADLEGPPLEEGREGIGASAGRRGGNLGDLGEEGMESWYEGELERRGDAGRDGRDSGYGVLLESKFSVGAGCAFWREEAPWCRDEVDERGDCVRGVGFFEEPELPLCRSLRDSV
jgi:hypothetical protein